MSWYFLACICFGLPRVHTSGAVWDGVHYAARFAISLITYIHVNDVGQHMTNIKSSELQFAVWAVGYIWEYTCALFIISFTIFNLLPPTLLSSRYTYDHAGQDHAIAMLAKAITAFTNYYVDGGMGVMSAKKRATDELMSTADTPIARLSPDALLREITSTSSRAMY